MITVPFALYVCAMASGEKVSSGSADTAFVSNCDHDYNYVVHIQTAGVLCSVPMYKRAIHSIMELILLWISKCLIMIKIPIKA